MSETTRPTPEQIAHFLAMFDLLACFEAQHHDVRGWGLTLKRPDPDVVAVLDWLRRL